MIIVYLISILLECAYGVDVQEIRSENSVSYWIRSGHKSVQQRERLIVKFKHGTRHQFLQGHVATPLKTDGDTFIVDIGPDQSQTAVMNYGKRPDVIFAEPDSVVSIADTIPNDVRYEEQWALPKIAAPAAWDLQTDASDVIVAVVDTGISYTHEDLEANLWTDPNTNSHGFSCFGTCIPGGEDDQGHGTHVAGVIGAQTFNTSGVAGINWRVQLLSMKFLNSEGFGYTSDAVLVFDKLVELKRSGLNIRVSNNSWGGSGYSQAVMEALERAEAAGILTVAAAGNYVGITDVNRFYPADYPLHGIISVMATDSADITANFSAWGVATVDIAAPGVNVLSTVPTGSCSLCNPGGYSALSGTSMATPHVAGVAAAIFHRNPTLSVYEARDIILAPSSRDPLPPQWSIDSTTSGRLNFAKAIQNPMMSGGFKLNSFPTLSLGPYPSVTAGTPITLDIPASDADSDLLTKKWYDNDAWTWLVGMELPYIFRTWGTPPLTFNAPVVSRLILMNYVASVNDGRGGSDMAPFYLTLLPTPGGDQPPLGTLTVTPLEGPPGTSVNIHFDATSPYTSDIWWDNWWYWSDGIVATVQGGGCHHVPSTKDQTLTLNREGLYLIGVNAIDTHLNETEEYRAIVKIGNPPAGTFPIAVLNVDNLSGTAPLTIEVDGFQSYDPDGFIEYYRLSCDWVRGPVYESPTATCTYNKPGVYVLQLLVADNSWLPHTELKTIVVTPDIAKPTIVITSPSQNETVDSTLLITAEASDDAGVTEVRFFMDGTQIGSDTSTPFQMSLDVSESGGPHTITATATDFSDNVGASQSVDINIVDHRLPAVSVISPQTGSALNGAFLVAANASDNDRIARVDFYVDGALAGQDLAAPYQLQMDASSMSLGSHQLWGVAFDRSQNHAISSTVEFSVECGTLAIGLSRNFLQLRSQDGVMLTSSNGKPDFVYLLVNGKLPMGMSFDPNGSITGQPIAIGSFALSVQSTDSRGCVTVKDLLLNVTGYQASNFEDGSMDGWKVRNGIWTVNSGQLTNTTTTSAKIESPVINCVSCTYDLDMIAATPHATTRINFWYKDSSNFLEILIQSGQGKLKIKYKSGGVIQYTRKIPFLFDTGIPVRLRVTYSPQKFNILVDDSLLQSFSVSKSPLPGNVRLQNKHAVDSGVAVPTTLSIPGLYAY